MRAEHAEGLHRGGGPGAVEEFWSCGLDQRARDRLTRAIDRELGSRWIWQPRPPARFARFVESRPVAVIAADR